MCVCVCVSPEVINYIHMIMNLYIKLSEFAMYVSKCNEIILSMGMALAMICIVKERNQPNKTMVMLYKSLMLLKGWF